MTPRTEGRGETPAPFSFPKTKDVLAQGVEAFNARRYDKALDIFASVLNVQPDNADALFNVGNLFMATGLHGVAANVFARLVEMNPGNISATMNLGTARRRCEDYEGAAKCFRSAINMLTAGRMDESLQSLLLSECYSNLSGLFGNNGTPKEMERLARQSIAHKPDSVLGNFHLGLALLEQGRWAEARGPYRKRMERDEYHARNYHSDRATPEWDMRARVGVLAVHGEQGVGDEIMFAPAIREAWDHAETILIECAARLVPAFRRMFPFAGVYPTHEALMAEWRGRVDAKISMADLFLGLRDGPANCSGVPYLTADPKLGQMYREKLDALGAGLKIGIAWRGGTDKTHAAIRKVPLKLWRPILDNDCRFISIQYTPMAQAEAEAFGIPHWHDAATDIEHHIACISQLDLVITVSQSALHFAGALGTPCWVLTPSKPDWRLGLEGGDLPLYGSVKLFRQKADDWTAVINNVAEALCRYARQESGGGNTSRNSASPTISGAAQNSA